ncbi:MAG: nicotinate-nucleotide adenylyltransferase [Desulfobulbaceae bacterium]|nr:nicotinate-nucleotide adenylyltransferase [Desulfobulbaceae bacterium]
MKQIGLFGGTFDPVHNGHLAVARAVLEQLEDLDEVLFIPSASPPHKPEELISRFDQRVTMLRLALEDNPRFSISTIEAERSGPSYTIETLPLLRKALGQDVSIYFIIGLDAFAEITTWKNYKDLLAAVSFVVIDRPSHLCSGLGQLIPGFLPYFVKKKDGLWVSSQGRIIVSLAMKPVNISSSLIRKKVQKGESLDGLVPPAVERYIHEQGLYKQNPI